MSRSLIVFGLIGAVLCFTDVPLYVVCIYGACFGFLLAKKG